MEHTLQERYLIAQLSSKVAVKVLQSLEKIYLIMPDGEMSEAGNRQKILAEE